MQHEAEKYLEDIARAAELIAEFTAGKTLADYMADPMLRAAVERKFEIIGEALVHLQNATRPSPYGSANTSASSPFAMC